MAITWLSPVLFQTPKEIPFAKDIAAFKESDRKNPPAIGQILFIGSSSFTRWKDVGTAFAGYPILNRAFGGSTLTDVIRYVDDVVTPYRPKQILIYCGENDLAGDATLPAYQVVERFKTLFRLIRQRFPSVPIAYVSMKPSPSRWHLRAKYIAGNRWISEFCAQEKNATYIDVWKVMLNERGEPKPEIFVADRLHMNAEGYKLWIPLIRPVLLKKVDGTSGMP